MNVYISVCYRTRLRNLVTQDLSVSEFRSFRIWDDVIL